jgi:hypothetical protein
MGEQDETARIDTDGRADGAMTRASGGADEA